MKVGRSDNCSTTSLLLPTDVILQRIVRLLESKRGLTHSLGRTFESRGVYALANIGGEKIEEPLLTALKDDSSIVRRAAAGALKRFDSKNVKQALYEYNCIEVDSLNKYLNEKEEKRRLAEEAKKVPCSRCNRRNTLKMESGKYWCSWCNDWAITLTVEIPSDIEKAMRSLFVETLPHIPVLTRDQIERYSRDWAGGYTRLYWGSQSEVENLVLRHFQGLKQQPKFESFRIHKEKRWDCAFATTFYSGVANFLLVWRGENEFAVAHT